MYRIDDLWLEDYYSIFFNRSQDTNTKNTSNKLIDYMTSYRVANMGPLPNIYCDKTIFSDKTDNGR